MTEKSYLWTTGGAGDGSATYTRADWQKIAKILAAVFGAEGVSPSWLNALEGTVTGANTASINTGGAIVDGKPYDNDAAVSVNVPSAVGVGNTRIDRIVLRADWTAQTVRITRIAGTDAASPTAPAITTTSGTTYDVKLYQALVNTSGTVTLTDERELAEVGTSEIDDNAVTDAKIRQSAARSVIGRYTTTTGNVADIVAGNDGHVLRRESGNLEFGFVDTQNLATDSVDDTIVGDRVPQFYRRQGGSATNWSSPGTTDYTPTAVRMQAGVIRLAFSTSEVFESETVTFATAFSQIPLVIVSVIDHPVGVPVGNTFVPNANLVSASGFDAECYRGGSTGTAADVDVAWLAIGPE